MSAPNPILVEIVRGTQVESVHRGAACIVDAAGRIVRAWGDVDRLVCPRSTIKPLQALPLIESGAADHFSVSAEEVALACASHSGASMHVQRVAAWLQRIGLSERDLECGAHAPAGDAYEDLLRAGRRPTALHNNCSGKHAGFLTLALHLKAETKGYTSPGHPVQRAVVEAVARRAECNATALPVVKDGCSAVNVFLPLHRLALALARLGTADAAARRVIAAMKAHPLLCSGPGRPDAAIIPALAGMGIVKGGAEGVHGAVLPEQRLGVAVKIDDGAGRASTIALIAILERLKAFTPDGAARMAALKEPVQYAYAGGATGVMRPAVTWDLAI